jgi:hypothetical protein
MDGVQPAGLFAVHHVADQQGGSNTFHDLQVRYSLPWDGTVSLGVNNVFDHQGPIMQPAEQQLHLLRWLRHRPLHA